MQQIVGVYLVGGAVVERTKGFGNCAYILVDSGGAGSKIRALLVHGVAVDNGARADVVESSLDSHGDCCTVGWWIVEW